MAEKRARPGGIIAPIPTFKAYEAFAYSATRLRSPFDRPIEVREITQLQAISADQARRHARQGVPRAVYL
jgi:type IV pilus assembly protein PilP